MPMEWTVDWDEVPIANATVCITWSTIMGQDWDKDAMGVWFELQGDPKYFGIVEVIPPLVPVRFSSDRA